MLASRIAAVTIATGALVAAASPAFADITVNPNPVSAGSKVFVEDADGSTNILCAKTDKTAVAFSDGFKDGRVALSRDDSDSRDNSWGSHDNNQGSHDNSWGNRDKRDELTGEGWATWKPGTYAVTVVCASGAKGDNYWLKVVPHGVPAGDGASIIGGSTTEEATGLALLAGALGVGAFAMRRKFKADR